MSWGVDLWDQYDNLSVHTLKGLEFCEKYARFVKERCEIENDYARNLKKLVKNYQPKKKGEDENEFTCSKGFVMMVNEIHDVAGQHEQISENLFTSVYKELQNLLHEHKKERKELLAEANKLNNQLQSQIAQLDRVKKKYEKSFGEAEKSQEAYQKADADINLSRADVEKSKNIMHQKQQHCETCKKEYASELQKTNQFQNEHYSNSLPKVYQDLQNLEQRRIEKIKNFINHSADTERSVIPIVNTCIDGIVRAGNTVNPTEDIRLVIEKYKSGFVPPGDIPFEDLSNDNINENHNNQNQHTPKAQRSDTFKGTQTSKNKKRGGIFGIFSSSKASPSWKGEETRDDYSHLPPNQQKKRLQQKLDIIRQSIAKETAERDGMQKMRDVYLQNPKLGDPASLDRQLEENAQKLDQLNQELQKFEGYLMQAEKRSNTLDPHDTSGVQRKMSDLSITSSNTGSNPSTPNTGRSSKTLQAEERTDSKSSIAESSSESAAEAKEKLTYQNVPNNVPANINIKTKITNTVPANDSPQTRESVPYNDGNESFDDEVDEFTVIGTCRALYAFEAPNEGSIPMKEGEDLQVVESDQGDGWTRVRRDNGDEGFVPTSYVELHMY